MFGKSGDKELNDVERNILKEIADVRDLVIKLDKNVSATIVLLEALLIDVECTNNSNKKNSGSHGGKHPGKHIDKYIDTDGKHVEKHVNKRN